MAILYSFLFIIIIMGALGILYVYQYNLLQHSKTKIDQAEVLIDEALRGRYDVLTKIDQLFINEIDKKSFFKDLDKLKEENISNFELDRKLVEYFNLMEQIKIDHKEMATNKDLANLLKEDKKVVEKLSAAKSYYNKYTSELNDLVRSFPSNIIASIFNFKPELFFEIDNFLKI